MNLTPVGIDIAKTVFQVHYVDYDTGEVVNKPIRRAAFLEHFANWSLALSEWKRAAERTTGHASWCRWGIRSS
jgi:hypothetical protein